MGAALARHDDLLLQAVSANRGAVFSKGGDGMAVVFGRAGDAIAAAVAAQQAFEIEPWPTALRVRMGVHTGEAEERGGDYFGPAVNRAARLMSEATGGQVLVSLSTTEVVRDRLPEGLTLVELGERTLRSLSRPERVFELIWSADREPLPEPCRRSAGRPTGPRSALIGRDAELADIIDMVGSERLVTLVGPGGVGKTTLAMEAARRDRTGRETAVVILTSVTDPTVLADVLASALGLRGNIGDPLQAAVALLGSRPWLVVIDNCEHLLPAVRDLVATLSNSCDELTILATSRERLGLPFEQVCRVAPLPLPASDQRRRSGQRAIRRPLRGAGATGAPGLRDRRRSGRRHRHGGAPARRHAARHRAGRGTALVAQPRRSRPPLGPSPGRAGRGRRMSTSITARCAPPSNGPTTSSPMTSSASSVPSRSSPTGSTWRPRRQSPARSRPPSTRPPRSPTSSTPRCSSPRSTTCPAIACSTRCAPTASTGWPPRTNSTARRNACCAGRYGSSGWIERAVITEDEPSAAACLRRRGRQPPGRVAHGAVHRQPRRGGGAGGLPVVAALVARPQRVAGTGRPSWRPILASSTIRAPCASWPRRRRQRSRRGQLEDSEMFARRGLELAGDRDSEGRWRCGIELAALDLYQGRLAEGIARYVSLAVPGWEAFDLRHRRRCAPPMRGTSMTPADSTSEPGPPPPAPR